MRTVNGSEVLFVFAKNAEPEMFDRVLNTPLRYTMPTHLKIFHGISSKTCYKNYHITLCNTHDMTFGTVRDFIDDSANKTARSCFLVALP